MVTSVEKQPTVDGTIAPHGGALVNRELAGEAQREAEGRAKNLSRLRLTDREVCDVEMIAVGAMSPLEGFMAERDYVEVVDRMQLSSGLAWSIPICKQVTEEERKQLREGTPVALEDAQTGTLALLRVESIFQLDKKKEARQVFGTEEETHPAVATLYANGPWAIGGRLEVVRRPRVAAFAQYRMTPLETRRAFAERKWKRVVAFQTRNPIHRAHEYIQKCAMEIADGMLLHPLVGETKGDDVPAAVRVRCYEVILEKYYPKDRVLMAVFPAAMRYAGPREAIFHALVRKNYGCTHFIVGRDHAGVSRPDGTPYYGTFDAQRIFDEFGAGEIGITPLFFDHTFYCKTCGEMASVKTCPHDKAHHVSLSGSKVRQMLSEGARPPEEFSRPEVADVLIEAYRKK